MKELAELRKRNAELEAAEKERKLPENEYLWGIKNGNEMTFEQTIQNFINILPYFIIVVDEDHNILLANDTALTVTGKKLENIIGCYCPKLIHGLDEPFPGCPLEEALEKGHYIEKDLLDPLYSSWVSSGIYPTAFKTQDGKRVFLHFIRDINDRKKAEEALLKSENKFRTIVEAAPSLLLITDKEGNNIYVSPNCEEITGYKQEELLNKIVWWVHKDDTSRAREIFERSFREKIGGRNYEYKAVRKNGDIWYASSSWVSIEDNDGNFNGYVMQTLDITERKRAEEQLRKTQKELESKSKNLEETNIALKVLLEHLDEDKKNIEKNIHENIKTLILPYLEKLKYSSQNKSNDTLLNIIETNLSEIVKPFTTQLTNKEVNLSPTQVRVAKMVKEGKTAKEIAEIMHISENTVKEHNSQIRKKLGIKRKKVNLRTYLQYFFGE